MLAKPTLFGPSSAQKELGRPQPKRGLVRCRPKRVFGRSRPNKCVLFYTVPDLAHPFWYGAELVHPSKQWRNSPLFICRNNIGREEGEEEKGGGEGRAKANLAVAYVGVDGGVGGSSSKQGGCALGSCWASGSSSSFVFSFCYVSILTPLCFSIFLPFFVYFFLFCFFPFLSFLCSPLFFFLFFSLLF